MKPSRKIRVRKRDGSVENFDETKLAGTIRRVLARVADVDADAADLARAIHLYLYRTRRRLISSAAVYEMVIKALYRVRLGEAAELFELHHTLRVVRRRLLRVRHNDGRVTQWDKSWLAELTERMWLLSRRTARMLAAEVELLLLPQEETEITRDEVLDMLNHHVSQWGLAEPVPVSGVG